MPDMTLAGGLAQTAARPLPAAPADAAPLPFWRTLWTEARPWRGQLVFAAVCSLVVGAAVAVQQNLIVKWLVDDAVLATGPDGQALPAERRVVLALGVVGLYLALSAARMLLWAWGYMGLVRAIEGLVTSLRTRLFRHIQGLCFRFHDRMSSGELYSYMMGSPTGAVKDFLMQFSMSMPFQVVSFVVCLGFLTSFDPWFAAVTLALAACTVLVNQRSQRLVREQSVEFMQVESQAGRYVADVLRGSRAIKVYAREQTVSGQVEQHLTTLRDKGVDLTLRRWIESAKSEAIQYLGMGLVYAMGAWFLIRGRITPGQFFAFITSFGLLMGPLGTLMQLNLVRANAEVGLERIFRVLQADRSTPELPEAEREQVARRAAEVPAVERGIAVEDLSFAYDPARPVLQGISLRIPEGQSAALVGASGSGKSTFASLLLRLYDPQQGRILLHGADLNRYGLRDLRGSFGVVPQDPFMFQASVRENLRVTRPGATDDELREALGLAQALDFVAALPQGLDTPVGEGGANLSGGQRQRLAIARAILAKPRQFLFDEATSALDNESEARIQTALGELMRGRTTLIIAHRLSTIRRVDRVLVFHQGRVVQDGTYDALAAIPGHFHDLLAGALAPH
jgi:ABC-type multidrug transport system fused ATPase/permease subunit